MRRAIVALAAALALVGGGCEEVARKPPKRTSNDDVLPYLPGDGDVRGLTPTVEPRRLEGEQLSQHLRAEAGLYLAYGVDHAASARYENRLTQAEGEERAVQVDVFRMRDPTAAYGIYTHQSHVLEPPTSEASVGAEARLGGLSARHRRRAVTWPARSESRPSGRSPTRGVPEGNPGWPAAAQLTPEGVDSEPRAGRSESHPLG
ncbi:MAG: DUF6599 family protein [bacterium]